MSLISKPVFLIDGAPLGFSWDVVSALLDRGSKFIVAVKSADGKWEQEFVKQIRKSNGDGIAVDPPERTASGITQMLDKGLSRYGRLNGIMYFRHMKTNNAAQFLDDCQNKILPGVKSTHEIYESLLKPRGESYRTFLILSGLPYDDSRHLIQDKIQEEAGDQLTCLYTGLPLKSNPFLSADQATDKETLSWLVSKIQSYYPPS
ncbi:MAG: hypothetical protein HUU10_10445 [Bacteroidetes bacterium]|nr:hypothetical protein [Bacteroidota bacterium]